MIVRTRTIGFTDDRTPMLRKIRLGFEGDNMVERLVFVLPEIADSQTAVLMMGGAYANAVTLEKNADGRYFVDLTAEMVGTDGEVEAYVRIDGSSSEVWHSGIMRLVTGELPDVEIEIEQRFPTAVEQMLTEMAAHGVEMEAQSAAAESAAQRAEAAADRAENAGGGGSGGGIIEETDPTVPDWAKQPNKPTYTAEEVGALAADQLQPAVNGALAQAKASGEFDGADGQPGRDGADGYTPVKGVDYFDGQDGAPGNPGVYVGSGTPPEGTTMQLDPEGDASALVALFEGLTEEEQAQVRDAIGIVDEGEFELLHESTLTEAVMNVTIPLPKKCREVLVKAAIPTEEIATNRSFYVSAELANPSKAFARVAGTSATNVIVEYWVNAKIRNGRIDTTHAVVTNTGEDGNNQYQNTNETAILNGVLSLPCEAFETLCIFTYNAAFPAGTAIQIEGLTL